MPARTPAKIDVGGVKVTQEEIRSAIDVLSSSTWIMVRQPLTSAGHPLAGANYLDVAREQRRVDGDRTVSTKIAFIHALERLLVG